MPLWAAAIATSAVKAAEPARKSVPTGVIPAPADITRSTAVRNQPPATVATLTQRILRSVITNNPFIL